MCISKVGLESTDSPPRGPSSEIRLVSISLDADGSLIAKTSKRPNGQAQFFWQLDEMVKTAKPEPTANKHSPLDMVVADDTEIVFQLVPSAWSWEDDLSKAFFLKDKTQDGKAQTHNPFGVARTVEGRPDMIVVRYMPESRYRGCRYEFNLGVVARGENAAVATPLIIDPIIENGGNPPQ